MMQRNSLDEKINPNNEVKRLINDMSTSKNCSPKVADY